MKVLLSSGGAFWGVLAFYIVVGSILMYNYFKVRKAGMVVTDKNSPGGVRETGEKVKGKENGFLKLFIGLTVVIIGFFIWMYNDYRPYDPKKDGVSKEQTDTTRQAAEEMLPK